MFFLHFLSKISKLVGFGHRHDPMNVNKRWGKLYLCRYMDSRWSLLCGGKQCGIATSWSTIRTMKPDAQFNVVVDLLSTMFKPDNRHYFVENFSFQFESHSAAAIDQIFKHSTSHWRISHLFWQLMWSLCEQISILAHCWSSGSFYMKKKKISNDMCKLCSHIYFYFTFKKDYLFTKILFHMQLDSSDKSQWMKNALHYSVKCNN